MASPPGTLGRAGLGKDLRGGLIDGRSHSNRPEILKGTGGPERNSFTGVCTCTYNTCIGLNVAWLVGNIMSGRPR